MKYFLKPKHFQMLFYALLATSFLAVSSCRQSTQETEHKAIKAVLSQQITDWNNGDIEGFMKGYFNSETLRFHTKTRSTYGWAPVLANYQKSFPNRDDIGRLAFDIDTIYPLAKNLQNVAGQWIVYRNDTISGRFVLSMYNFGRDGWKIIEDHTW